MNNIFSSDISIEKFASYMDGNLSSDDFNEVSSIIESDEFLKEFSESFHELDDISIDSDIHSLEAERDGICINEVSIPSIDEEIISSLELFPIVNILDEEPIDTDDSTGHNQVSSEEQDISSFYDDSVIEEEREKDGSEVQEDSDDGIYDEEIE